MFMGTSGRESSYMYACVDDALSILPVIKIITELIAVWGVELVH